MRLVCLILLLAPVFAQAMPPVVAAVASLAVAAAPAALISAGVGLAINAAIMVASVVYGRAQAKKEQQAAKDAYNASLEDRTITAVSASSAHTYVYGRARVGSSIVAIFTSGSKDQYKHLVCIHAAHEVDGYENLWIAGEEIGELDSNGMPISGEYAREKTTTSSVRSTNWYFSGGEGHSGDTYNLNHEPVDVPQDGGTYLAVDYDIFVYHRVDERAVLDSNATITNQTITLVDSRGSSTRVVYSYYTSQVSVRQYLGTATDPVDSYLHNLFPSEWPATSVLRGFAYSVITLDLNVSEFQSGIPTIEVLVRGKKLYDLRTGETAWSQNNALVIYDYLTSKMCGVDAADLPEVSYITAANVCDEQIAVGDRYTFNGTVTSDEDQQTILEQMAQSMAGVIVSTTWDVWAGKYVAPVMALTQSDIIGSAALAPGVSDADIYNGVTGQYVGSETEWVATDVTPYQNATYVVVDGRELWTDISFAYTNSAWRIHNLARIFVEDQREGATFTAEFSLKAWVLRVGERITLSHTRYGWEEKVFRVLNKRFSPSSAVELTLKEDAESIWDEADEVTLDVAPNSNLKSPFIAPELEGLAMETGSDALIMMGDGTIVSRIKVSWTDPAELVVVDVEWSEDGTTWQRQTVEDSISTYISPVRDGQAYLVRARTRKEYTGAVSSWVYAEITVIGKTAPPDTPTGVALSVSQQVLKMTLTENAEVDLAGYEVRLEDAGWGSEVNALFKGRATSFQLDVSGLGEKTFYVKAFDTSGNYSELAVSATYTIAAPPPPSALSYKFADTATTVATVTLDWEDAQCPFGLSHYIVQDGGLQTTVKSNVYTTQVNWIGNKTFTISAVDNLGNASAEAQIVVQLQAPGTPTNFRAQVIDNNVLMYWDAPAKTSLPIVSHELRSGQTWETAEIIGGKAGGFTTVFESEGGEKKYWLAAVDSNAQAGAPVSLVASVMQPPDYRLFASVDSDLSGAKNSVATDFDGTLLVPISTTQTWSDHFTNNNWTSPQEQINAGYPHFIQPSDSVGYYEEEIDYGTVLGGSRVMVTLNGSDVVGTVSTSCEIHFSEDGITWTTVQSWSYYAVSFRYIKVKITFVALDTGAFYRIDGINVRLDAKLLNDAGSVAAVATDSGGTEVSFNTDFIAVSSIVPGVMGTSPLTPVIDFSGTPNPTGFHIYLFDETGARASGTVSWSARGY